MKSEYFLLLPNDICCSLQSFAAIALKTKKLWREICHTELNDPVSMTELP